MEDETQRLLAEISARHYRHVIFDLDGTLVQMQLSWQEWIQQVTALLPVNMHSWFRRQFTVPGSAWGEAVNYCILGGYLEAEDYLRICRQFESTDFPYIENQPLVTALRMIRERGTVVSLWSNNSDLGVDRILSGLALNDVFNTVVTRADVRLGKPDAEGWLLLSGIAPAEGCVLVGDSDNDRLAARKAGISYFEITYFKRV